MAVHTHKIYEKKNIHLTHPDFAAEFEKGHFVVNKTALAFSRVPVVYQAHEQNNASVKGKGGAVGITQNPAALRRRTVGGPEIARIVQDFEVALDTKQLKSNTNKHFQSTMNRRKVNKLLLSKLCMFLSRFLRTMDSHS